MQGVKLMANTKPPIESLIPYLKQAIPNCGISDSEIAELRKIYPLVSFKDIRRVYYEAINKKSMQPISYMVRALQVMRPQNDPFRLNPQARYGGRRVEVGTDWKAKKAQKKAQEDAERQAYDKVHGAGAYDAERAKETAKWREIYSHLDEYLGIK